MGIAALTRAENEDMSSPGRILGIVGFGLGTELLHNEPSSRPERKRFPLANSIRSLKERGVSSPCLEERVFAFVLFRLTMGARFFEIAFGASVAGSGFATRDGGRLKLFMPVQVRLMICISVKLEPIAYSDSVTCRLRCLCAIAGGVCCIGCSWLWWQFHVFFQGSPS